MTPSPTRVRRRVRRRAVRTLTAVLMVASAPILLAASGCAVPGRGEEDAIRAGLAAGTPLLHPRVLATLPHDTDAWTEGLDLSGGLLYEGTGLAGHSQLRELDPSTGRVLRAADVPHRWYGEGVAALGDRLWELTYTDHVALPWDRRTLTPGRPVRYPGQGWGLCHGADGRLVASDGTDRLRLLSDTDLRELGTVAVRVADRPLRGLNGLDCQPGAVWANVYPTDFLVRIDLASGTVTSIVDASALVPASARAHPDTDVLNGIAAIPGTDQFVLTGKRWPTLLRVRLTPGGTPPAR